MQKCILLTGFEPFGGRQINQSFEIIKDLQGQEINEYLIIVQQLPVVWQEAANIVIKSIKKYSPMAVVMFGEASSSEFIRLEQRAVNKRANQDNLSNFPPSLIINESPDASFELFSTLNLQNIYNSLINIYPVEYSNTAGEYLCNETFYKVLNTDSAQIKGFIHVPTSPQFNLPQAIKIVVSKIAADLSLNCSLK
ncbi:Pyrrolidone-carboxylate_peptidase [Hexamita inflata]|uniref:Pyrrolidone-carboxylate peptidase n=1 Tax=Hexamita inflata TaxID=28002 RepID=A0AA86QRZ3_9EUKA|nr:Pyrrolidone-carboxylate peptidase [Hexamita inflata]